MVFFGFSLKAQDTLKNHFTAAVDLSPFSFEGFSVKIGVLPKKVKQTELAFEVFSMSIPEAVINLNPKNANTGWEEKVKTGIAFYVDKKLGTRRSSFWAGFGGVHLNHSASNGTSVFHYQQLEYLLRINYKWFPFNKSGFYINPYIALAGRHKVGGENGAYALTPFLIIPSVYLSWEI